MIKLPPMPTTTTAERVTMTFGPVTSRKVPKTIRTEPANMTGRRPKLRTSLCETNPTLTAPTAIAVPWRPPTPFEMLNCLVINRTFDPIDMMNQPHRLTAKYVERVRRSRSNLAKLLHYKIDTLGEGFNVFGVDRDIHCDAQLIAAKFAVGLDVNNSVRAQNLRDGCGIDRVREVDRAHNVRPRRGIGHERGRVLGILSPRVQVRRGLGRAASRPPQTTVLVHPIQLLREHQ